MGREQLPPLRLWEVGIDRPSPEGAKASFHAWLDLPRDEYARLFEEINGIPFRAVEKYVTGYPEIGGFRFPLDALRKVERDKDAGPIAVFSDEPVYRPPEQRNKAKLVLNTNIRTFGDFARPENHTIGIERAYLWREAGDPGRLHLWLVGYERIALVAHYAIPWNAP